MGQHVVIFLVRRNEVSREVRVRIALLLRFPKGLPTLARDGLTFVDAHATCAVSEWQWGRVSRCIHMLSGPSVRHLYDLQRERHSKDEGWGCNQSFSAAVFIIFGENTPKDKRWAHIIDCSAQQS